MRLLLFEYSNLWIQLLEIHLSIDCESRLLDLFTNFSRAFFINILWATNLEFFLYLFEKWEIISEWSSLLTRNSNYPHPISEKLRGDARQHNFEWYQQKEKNIPAGGKAYDSGQWYSFGAHSHIMNVFASHIKILNLIKERSIKRNINYLVGDMKSQRNKTI